MLRIHFKDLDGQIYGIDGYFNYNHLPEWAEDKLVQDILEDIDKCTYIGDGLFKHPDLGYRRLTDMSGGSKCLIYMLKRPNLIIRGSSMGENCAKWVEVISDINDVTMSLGYPMPLNPANTKDGIFCINSGKLMLTHDDMFNAIMEYL